MFFQNFDMPAANVSGMIRGVWYAAVIAAGQGLNAMLYTLAAAAHTNAEIRYAAWRFAAAH